MSTSNTNMKWSKPTILCLPREILVMIFSMLAKTCYYDVFTLRLCCKEFNDAANDDEIYKNITIKHFSVLPWIKPREEVLDFLDKCLRKGNPEALFRLGMKQYFIANAKLEKGLQNKKQASMKGHNTATYFWGLMMLCREYESAKEGLTVLNSLLKGKPDVEQLIMDCRNELEGVLSQFWIFDSGREPQLTYKCLKHGPNIRITFDAFEQFKDCLDCLWFFELRNLCRKLYW